MLVGSTLHSRGNHRVDVDISSVENPVFLFDFVFSDVSTYQLSGTFRFFRRYRWLDIEDINMGLQLLMSMILIHNKIKGLHTLTDAYKTKTITKDDIETNLFQGRYL